ncbi:ShlB/FhaC/HecB family hemolysin secretion/activation protein [Pseudaquabacterium pictum]|uniref:POTRA domain-containing protein n=1 Tax=Pseudaquabacterium pictum TaxID=2315236 RepID=A0A480APN8_9BURK|nr:ShlB/FhaC/HecB family hemolysin secretion/activation protein [Rubrivivax pictus]GCL62750.1 hypothetical protein AQPW35_18310 [Rubrivivax pictus]
MTTGSSRRLHALALAAAACLLHAAQSGNAHAQAVPDAGQILQLQRAQPQPPRADQPLRLPQPLTDTVAPGGPQVQLQAVQFSGHTVVSTEVLQGLVADAIGRPLDMAGLRALADRISSHYRGAGYLFARAILPAQPLDDGRLQITVVEGRYGSAEARADNNAWAQAGQAYLARLTTGSVIHGPALERAVLLLADLPGVLSTPVVQPGTAPGTGDLLVTLAQGPSWTGAVALDNHGNRYSGQHRLHASVDWNSPGLLGDRWSLRLMRSDERLWLGSLAYAAPLGGQGWRAMTFYAHTRYALGREFARLGATGTAQVASLGLGYPLLRSHQANLQVTAQLQRKRLRDDQAGTQARKASTTLPISWDLDWRDEIGGGGLVFGSLGWTGGRLRLPADQVVNDTNQTRGRFQKVNLDLARLQSLPGRFSLLGRMSAQWASRNLDSSERTSLGGTAGVRAYPSGEATGDQAWLLQAELRYDAGTWAPYLFADAGEVQINTRPVRASDINRRQLAGGGVGLRWQHGRWQADAAAAWSSRGGPAQADGGHGSSPRLWVNIGHRF